MTQLEAKS